MAESGGIKGSKFWLHSQVEYMRDGSICGGRDRAKADGEKENITWKRNKIVGGILMNKIQSGLKS